MIKGFPTVTLSNAFSWDFGSIVATVRDKLRLRRGTTAEHNAFTGDLGELTYNTDKKSLVAHDGVTQGGTALARESGDPTVRFKVASGSGADEAVTKSQLDSLNVKNANGVLTDLSGNRLSLVGSKEDYVLTKNLDFNDGVITELFDVQEFGYGEYLFLLTFSTTSHGGSIYTARLTGVLTMGADSNDAPRLLSIPFSQGYHALNGRTVKLFLKLRGDNQDHSLDNTICMQIDGESSTDVPVRLTLKRIF